MTVKAEVQERSKMDHSLSAASSCADAPPQSATQMVAAVQKHGCMSENMPGLLIWLF